MPSCSLSWAAASVRWSMLASGMVVSLAVPALARPVYRCPGPPVSYTDALTPEEAQGQSCRTIDGQPVTIAQPSRLGPPPADGAAPLSGTVRPNLPRALSSEPRAEPRVAMRIDPAVQRTRDADARRILQEELKREEEGLTGLMTRYRQGQPERRPEDANPQVYQQRVDEMKAAIDRKQSDIAAIRRELSKLSP